MQAQLPFTLLVHERGERHKGEYYKGGGQAVPTPILPSHRICGKGGGVWVLVEKRLMVLMRRIIHPGVSPFCSLFFFLYFFSFLLCRCLSFLLLLFFLSIFRLLSFAFLSFSFSFMGLFEVLLWGMLSVFIKE